MLHTGAMVCFRTVWLGLLGAALGGCTVSESPRELGVWVAEGVSLVDGALVVPTDDVIGWSPLEGVLPVGRVSVIQVDEQPELGFDPDTGSVKILGGAKVTLLATESASVSHRSEEEDDAARCFFGGGANCGRGGSYAVKSLFVAVLPQDETAGDTPFVLQVNDADGAEVGRAEFAVGALGAVRWVPDRSPFRLDAADRSLEVGARAETPEGRRLFVPAALTVVLDEDGAPAESAVRCVFGACAVLPISVCAGEHRARFVFTVDAPPLGETAATRDFEFEVSDAYADIWGATKKACE